MTSTSNSPRHTQYRKLRVIAHDIQRDWRKMNPYAAPYVQAMLTLDTTEDLYGLDTGEEVVKRFLTNAATWQGPVARTIKTELRGMLK